MEAATDVTAEGRNEIALSVYLVVQTMFAGIVAAVIAALNAALFGWFWFGLPMLRRARDGA